MTNDLAAARALLEAEGFIVFAPGTHLFIATRRTDVAADPLDDEEFAVNLGIDPTGLGPDEISARIATQLAINREIR
jgi:hypothetical protein